VAARSPVFSHKPLDYDQKDYPLKWKLNTAMGTMKPAWRRSDSEAAARLMDWSRARLVESRFARWCWWIYMPTKRWLLFCRTCKTRSISVKLANSKTSFVPC